ncbi:C-X-C motif chemokine 13 [Pelodytes ibericus]
MTLKQIPIISMLALLVIVPSVGGLLEPSIRGGKCKCFTYTEKFIHPNTYKSVQIFPATQACPKMEILIRLKKGSMACVTTDSNWVQKLLEFLIKNVQNPRPTTKPREQVPL